MDDEETHFKRDLNWLQIVAAGFDTMATWITFPSTLLLSFIYGGPVCTIWGVVLVGAVYLPVAITLCELVAMYPTIGGQYHWVSILSPAKYRRIMSYACGSLSWFSWITLAAAGNGALGNYVICLISWFHPDFVVEKWHVFLLFQCSNVVNLVANAWFSSMLPNISSMLPNIYNIFACITIFVATLVGQRGGMNTSEFVWTTFSNSTGWPAGVTFLITLSSPTVMFCPIDGMVHLVEDTKNAARVIPKAILTSLALSFVTSVAFAVATVYVISDFDAVLSAVYPAFEIWRQAMHSDAWAVAFMCFLLIMVPVSTFPATQIVSRMTFSFANDKALLFSDRLTRVNPKTRVPTTALYFNAFLIFLIGCLYLISSTAFLAILSISVVFQQITLAFPSAVLLFRRRDAQFLPANRPFKVPSAVGWACNIISVAYAIIAVIFFQFPYTTVVDLGTMNYTCLVFGSFIAASTASWFFIARKSYNPPAIRFSPGGQVVACIRHE
ncbi:amino acid transporter [Thozetella sp. PMI_491]|nr:amino acid transporter [Thozetella sp. PMI_491]